MQSLEARRCYRDALNSLYSTVKLRNSLVRQIDLMAAPAMSVTLATCTVIQFDTDRIRQFLADIDELTPRISAGIEEVNLYAEDAGLPRVRWQAPYS